MGVFDGFIDLAESLISANGEESTLIRTTPGTPADATKPWEPGTPSATSVTVSTVWLNQSVVRNDKSRKEDEIFALLSAKDLSFEPDPRTDQMKRKDGNRYAILTVEPLNPNGQKIIYELKCRR